MCEWLERCDDLVQVLDCHFSKILSPKTSILTETLRERDTDHLLAVGIQMISEKEM